MIGKIAKLYDVDEFAVQAIVKVESAGRAFNSDGSLVILFEPHVFYRELKGKKRDLAVKLGLAYKKWRTKPYPKSQKERHKQLQAGIKIDEEAAYRSASYGLGQIMGFNHRLLGFKTAKAMVKAFEQGEYEQILGIMQFSKATGALDKIRGKDLTKPSSWEGFARIYNGAGYKKNKYHIRLANAYKNAHKSPQKHEIKKPTPTTKILKKGMSGAAVKKLQQDLSNIGYKVAMDGIFGQKTHDAVVRFQIAAGLEADGIVGKKTRAEIDKLLKKPKSIWQIIFEAITYLLRR